MTTPIDSSRRLAQVESEILSEMKETIRKKDPLLWDYQLFSWERKFTDENPDESAIARMSSAFKRFCNLCMHVGAKTDWTQTLRHAYSMKCPMVAEGLKAAGAQISPETAIIQNTRVTFPRQKQDQAQLDLKFKTLVQLERNFWDAQKDETPIDPQSIKESQNSFRCLFLFIDESSNSWLHQAAVENCPMIVDSLISGRADVNSCDASGKTPLRKAEELGHESVVQALLARGGLLRKPQTHFKPSIFSDDGYSDYQMGKWTQKFFVNNRQFFKEEYKKEKSQE